MVFAINNTPTGSYLSIASALTCGITLVGLFISLAKQVNDTGAHRIRRSSRYPVYGAFVSSIILCFYIGGVRAVVVFSDLLTFGQWYCRSASLGYWFSKFFLYIFFIDRLVVSFRDCQYRYNKNFVWFARAFVTLFLVLSSAGSVMMGKQVSQFGCQMSEEFVYFVTVYDFIIQVSAIYLFVRPLQYLGKAMSQSSSVDVMSSERQKSLYKVVVKQLILASTAILSTLVVVTLVAGVLTDLAGVCMPIDVFINCVCMYESFNFHDGKGLYEKMCGPCYAICLSCYYRQDRVIKGFERQNTVMSMTTTSNLPPGNASMNRVYSKEPSENHGDFSTATTTATATATTTQSSHDMDKV